MPALIGITSTKINNPEKPGLPTIGQDSTYIDSIVNAGGTPIILPLTSDKKVLRDVYELVHGVLLSGGNDINPELYGEGAKPLTKRVLEIRDEAEAQFLKWALEEDKPILAICRGMQLVNVVYGGSLYQDVLTEAPGTSDHEISKKLKDYTHIAHHIEIRKETKLASILGTESIPANSFHHQAIKEIARGLHISAWAKDGIIEAIEDPQKNFLIGVQSHPEYLESSTIKTWGELFKGFVEAAEEYADTAVKELELKEAAQ